MSIACHVTGRSQARRTYRIVLIQYCSSFDLYKLPYSPRNIRKSPMRPQQNVTHFATLSSHYATQKDPDEIAHRGHVSGGSRSMQRLPIPSSFLLLPTSLSCVRQLQRSIIERVKSAQLVSAGCRLSSLAQDQCVGEVRLRPAKRLQCAPDHLPHHP